MKDKKLNLIGQLLLLFATLSWGTSFFILKETISAVNELFVLALRFLSSGILLGVIFLPKILKSDKKVILRGVILGVILVFAYIIQTRGLFYTTPSRNAFLTSAYCVMVPFIAWLITKNAPKVYNLISAFMLIVGIGFVSFSGKTETGSNLLLGDALTLGGAVFYALQIIFINKFQQNPEDTGVLLTFEVLTVGVVCAILTLIFELPTNPQGYALNLEQILKIGYLAIVCTLFAQMAQIFGQKYTTTNQASLILSLEAVFGTLFSVILGDEKMTAGLVIGFIIIFIAMMITEFKLDPVKLFNKKKSIE
ncbi:MAG: DMT family transporter [Clostridiales bacterium]|nr:DMT family transporter [Clostridiales bacterium]